MPDGAPHLCPGRCGNLIPRGIYRCDACQTRADAEDRARRGSATQRGYDAGWRAASKVFLSKHPLCIECEKDTKLMPVPATRVDHIVPHKGDHDLFWNEANWQPMCESHHNAKTAREDMGAWRPRSA